MRAIWDAWSQPDRDVIGAVPQSTYLPADVLADMTIPCLLAEEGGEGHGPGPGPRWSLVRLRPGGLGASCSPSNS